MAPDGNGREPVAYEPGEGCLTTAVRLPVRIVVLVLVVPVRMVWDALVAAAKAVDRTVLRPVGRGCAWLWRHLVVIPVGWVWRNLVVAPVVWLVRHLVVVPAQWLYAYLLAPIGRGIARLLRGVGAVLLWLGKALFVWPWVALWRYVLQPAGRMLATVVTVVVREVGEAFGHCWRVAGFLSRAVGRFLGAVLRGLFVEPVRWVYRTLLTPLGHAVRDGIWRPVRTALGGIGRATREALGAARASVRETRQEIRRALFGAPREPARRAAGRPRREPGAPEARTLGSSTTALTKD
ncbi:hypothetical protein ACWC2K_22455 [Streptomyces chattanoogensis]